MKKIIILFIFVFANCYSQAQQFNIAPSLYTSSEFLKEPQHFKEGYVLGVVEGLFVSPILGNEYKNIEKLRGCVFLINVETMLAVVETYIKLHGEMKETPINLVIFWAVRDACKSKGKDISIK